MSVGNRCGNMPTPMAHYISSMVDNDLDCVNFMRCLAYRKVLVPDPVAYIFTKGRESVRATSVLIGAVRRIHGIAHG